MRFAMAIFLVAAVTQVVCACLFAARSFLGVGSEFIVVFDALVLGLLWLHICENGFVGKVAGPLQNLAGSILATSAEEARVLAAFDARAFVARSPRAPVPRITGREWLRLQERRARHGRAQTPSLVSADSSIGYLVAILRGDMAERLGALASSWVLGRLTRRRLVVHWATSADCDATEMPARFHQLFSNAIKPLTPDLVALIERAEPRHCLSLGHNDLLHSPIECTFKILETDCLYVVLPDATCDYLPAFLDARLLHSAANRRFAAAVLDLYHDFFRRLQLAPAIRRQTAARLVALGHADSAWIGVHCRTSGIQIDNLTALQTAVHVLGLVPELQEQAARELQAAVAVSWAPHFFHVMEALQLRMLQHTRDCSGRGRLCILVASDSNVCRDGFAEIINRRQLDMAEAFAAGGVTDRERAIEPAHDTAAGHQRALVEFALLACTDEIVGTAGSALSDLATLYTTNGTKLAIGPSAFAGVRATTPHCPLVEVLYRLG